jgi:hypothetical protein
MRGWWIVGLAVLAGGGARAERPVVVELFTSQGCSSCPPADRLLGVLASEPGLLTLDFHVTYWNRLGWTDPFSLAAATERQDRYAALFGDAEVYTPEMVVDGRKAVVGSDEGAVRGAIASAGRGVRAGVGVVASRAGGAVDVSVGAGAGRGEVVMVGFDPRHDTAVGAGENDGRRLAEVDVVRSVRVVGAWTGAALRVRVPASMGERAAVLVQAVDGRMLGAALVGEPPV